MIDDDCAFGELLQVLLLVESSLNTKGAVFSLRLGSKIDRGCVQQSKKKTPAFEDNSFPSPFFPEETPENQRACVCSRKEYLIEDELS